MMRARVSVCKNTEEEEEEQQKKTREKDIFSLTESKIQMSLDILFYIVFVQLRALDYMR